MWTTYISVRRRRPQAYEECLQKAGVTDEETAYLGDDLPDMPLSRRAGFAIAVANAAPELKAISHYVTERRGGEGAAREVVELILKAQGRWETAIPAGAGLMGYAGSCGVAAISACVYGSRGAWHSASASPSSTTRPRCITTMRSAR